MVNSTFNPSNLGEFDKGKLQANHQSVSGTANFGATTYIDLDLSDDHLFTGIEIFAKGSTWGDTVTMQVVDKIGALPNGMVFPVNTVLNQFGTNIFLPEDVQEKLCEDSHYPAKIFAGLTLRVAYTSIGPSNVQVAVNYKLHKVLV
jgi:hypothetical protein